ncbi:peptide-N4-(N-acetyl-beta-glucosaminyl)asparagine amidase A-like [Tripterygium wilfordii]|uniref:peptide-N4-(N-acetyl-beta- glucosaminyl)asparagine amidase A-like n=1 Tax=Tripterygium wilfordii TaxID=458696 RepID=UPI0018F8496C|nr:peptide-N4-(N-acetyl-beta-glucosaminyl)asparagine amidase A-like [Tripterygium wilfordii]
MASFHLPLLLLLFIYPFSSKANLRKINSLLKSSLISQSPISSHTHLHDTLPKVFFEVTKPIKLPKTKPCKHLVLQHDFGYTYQKPPVLVEYNPPSYCTSQHFSKIVLEWIATCKGRQFDRIFGVWLGGVELLRGCTAEPTMAGTVWSVKKDITRYSSLLVKNEMQTLAVNLGNVVDSTYTGVYHVNITIYFYPAEDNSNSNHVHNVDHSEFTDGSKADLIIPISRNLPLNNGLWFEIDNESNKKSKEFKIPQNVYRAVLEVYVSFHEKDEFWYGNLPKEYSDVNNLADIPGNGPFREVVVYLDGEVVGAIWPFTVIYTGGIDPLLWRPITGIGSFDLPSYHIEITPFLGTMLDGKEHKISFSVTNALNVWYIDGNLHLWLDHKSMKTEGELLKHESMPLAVSLESGSQGLGKKFSTKAHRSISSSGWVKSSWGNITTHFNQNFYYSNSMLMENNGNSEIIDQVIHFNDIVYVKMPSSHAQSTKSFKKFLLYLNTNSLNQGYRTSLAIVNITLGFKERKYQGAAPGSAISSLKNLQKGQQAMVIKNNLITGLTGNTRQAYEFSDADFCYSRIVGSSFHNILYDKLGTIGFPCSDIAEKSQTWMLQIKLYFNMNRFVSKRANYGFVAWWFANRILNSYAVTVLAILVCN